VTHRKLSGRPPAFIYRASPKRRGVPELHCEGVSLRALADKFGTPLYAYSATAIKQRFQTFDAAFGGHPHTVCYSVKANSNLSILRLLAQLGSGFDVVSGGELERVLIADRRAARRVVFSGVGKTPAEMDAALRAGILMFNLESEAELHVLAERAALLRKTARIAFRVNPDVNAGTHPYIATGLHEHKFGVPIGEARTLYALAAEQEWLEPAGVSVHIGSQITNIAPFRETMQRVLALVRELLAEALTSATSMPAADWESATKTIPGSRCRSWPPSMQRRCLRRCAKPICTFCSSPDAPSSRPQGYCSLASSTASRTTASILRSSMPP